MTQFRSSIVFVVVVVVVVVACFAAVVAAALIRNSASTGSAVAVYFPSHCISGGHCRMCATTVGG